MPESTLILCQSRLYILPVRDFGFGYSCSWPPFAVVQIYQSFLFYKMEIRNLQLRQIIFYLFIIIFLKKGTVVHNVRTQFYEFYRSVRWNHRGGRLKERTRAAAFVIHRWESIWPGCEVPTVVLFSQHLLTTVQHVGGKKIIASLMRPLSKPSLHTPIYIDWATTVHAFLSLSLSPLRIKPFSNINY